MDKPKDKVWFIGITKLLGISKNRIVLDECHDYKVQGKEGKIYCVAPYWYVYLNPGSKRKWSELKKKLSFMEVHQDGDTEGFLRADFYPSIEQGNVVRKALKIKKSYTPVKSVLDNVKSSDKSTVSGGF